MGLNVFFKAYQRLIVRREAGAVLGSLLAQDQVAALEYQEIVVDEG